jgi:hypothetical protein
VKVSSLVRLNRFCVGARNWREETVADTRTSLTGSGIDVKGFGVLSEGLNFRTLQMPRRGETQSKVKVCSISRL